MRGFWSKLIGIYIDIFGYEWEGSGVGIRIGVLCFWRMLIWYGDFMLIYGL